MPSRLCLEPRCPEPAQYRGRCQRHQRERNRATHHNRSIYNSKRWAMLRRHVLYEQPLCATEGCVELATDVHHIQAIEDGGQPWARQNLEALCHSCHSKVTRREQQGVTT